MSESEIIVQSGSFIAPVADITTALRRYQMVKDFINQVLKEGTDYGTVPGGGDKPALLKPGAEKMASLFGFQVRFILAQVEEDWTGANHDGEPFFYYRYRGQLWRGDLLVAEGEGSCNSWEKKYRYRQAERVCPVCGKATIIKGKEEYGGGWLCFAKKGGCGAKFKDNDPAITGQNLGQVKNPDPADLVNTLQKMAQKRALVAPVLIATNTSDYFTQDIEDYIDGQVVSQAPEQATAKPALTREQAENHQKSAENTAKVAENYPEQPPLPTEDPAWNEQAAQAHKPAASQAKPRNGLQEMSFQEAALVLNKEGKPFGELSNETLAGMSSSIAKRMRGPRTAGEQADDERQLQAIKVILQQRNSPKM